MERTEKRSACRICGTTGMNRVYTVPEMMFGSRDAFEYVECSACGCLQIADIPADVSRYYPPNYYSFTPKRRRFQRLGADRFLRRIKDHYTVFKDSLPGILIHTLIPNRKLAALAEVRLSCETRILDVGCGDGWRLAALREIGFRNVLGVDPYLDRSLQYDNGVRVLKQTVHETGGAWDLIMYHHSFEHVPDPVRDLKSVSRMLMPGGCCLIRIPTVSSFAWEHYRECWVQIDAPRHYHLHSVRSMTMLANQAGFTVGKVIYDSTKDQFQGSELYRKGIPLVSGDNIFSSSQIRGWKRQARELNRQQRGDQAAFCLFKK